MLTAPDLPVVDAAEPIEIDPVVPELAVPELKASRPEAPSWPALDDAIVIAPLVLAMPCPLITPTAPPVCTVLWPEATVIKPPAPLLPTPTLMLTAPVFPPVEAPEPIDIAPEVPELAVPELNDSTPETPLSPAFDDAIVIAPLVLAMPCPLSTPTAPPVRTVLWPDATVIKPPAPLLPLPTVTLTRPAEPRPVAVPMESPDPIEMAPVEPELDVPELNVRTPPRPASPAFAERMLIEPLVLATPRPLVSDTAPPVCTVLCPAVTVNRPPVPLLP